MLRALFGVCLGIFAIGVSFAQELKEQPTPFSAWLDFKSIGKTTPRKTGLPIWIESVERVQSKDKQSTTFRMRLRHVGTLHDELMLRLYFLDNEGASPTVTGWTETGSQPFASPALGSGVGLDTSESMIIPAASLDYVDVEVPGDGKTVRGAFLASSRRAEVSHALDFERPAELVDAFGASSSLVNPNDDLLLYGRVKATIDSAPMKIDPLQNPLGKYEFTIESRPMLTAVTFEILGASPVEPVLAYINGAYAGPVNISFPDLADPGYQGTAVPLERDLRFRYAGWLRGQVIIPRSRMVEGLNTFILRVNDASSPVAVRAVEIQLKKPSPTFDYELKP